MIIHGIHLEHWRCIAQLDLNSLPAGIVVLHGPNRTGKSSVVKALRACLFDHEHKTSKRDLITSVPWNRNGLPRIAIEFGTGGQRYRITKVYSSKADGLAKLEQLRDGQWGMLEDSPKEAHRKTHELLGTDSSTSGLYQLLWLDQGEVALPSAHELDSSLERQMVNVLGVMVTGHDLGFKNVLEKRCEQWFGVKGTHKKSSPVTRLEELLAERRQQLEEQATRFREVEQAIRDLEDCENRLPESEKAVEAARQEVAEREQERERSQQRRELYQQALRDFRGAEEQRQTAQNALQAYQDVKTRWQESETQAARAEASVQALREEVDRLAHTHHKIAQELQAARLAAEENQLVLEEIENCRKLLKLSERRERLERILERARHLQRLTDGLQLQLKDTVAPDKPTLEALRENRQKAAKLRAQLHAGELTLRLNLRCPAQIRLRIDSEPAQTANPLPGAQSSWHFRQRASMELPEVGNIEITRGQENIDLERAAQQLARLDKEHREAVLDLRERPDEEGCLNRLTERWAEREATVVKFASARDELQQLAPLGLAALEGEWDKLNSQRQVFLERRPDLVNWQPSEEEVSQRERAFRTQAAGLQKARKDLEAAEKLASEVLQKARERDWECNKTAVAARTTANHHLADLQRLGDEHSLQANQQRAAETLANARNRLNETELTEAEQTVEQRCQDAAGALRLRQDRLQQLKDEMNRHRGRLEGSEGLHTRLADAEAAVQEAEEMLAGEKLEAEAHKRLRDLFEACRDSQVEQVMGPIGERVLEWAQSIGLNDYKEVRFGDRFLPEGILVQDGNPDKTCSLGEESYGTNEQLSLLVRLALGGVLAKDEPAVTILDDPLAHADSAKHRRILDIMRIAAEGNPSWTPPAGPLQILIFTCHPDRFDYLTGVQQIDLAKLIVREP